MEGIGKGCENCQFFWSAGLNLHQKWHFQARVPGRWRSQDQAKAGFVPGFRSRRNRAPMRAAQRRILCAGMVPMQRTGGAESGGAQCLPISEHKSHDHRGFIRCIAPASFTHTHAHPPRGWPSVCNSVTPPDAQQSQNDMHACNPIILALLTNDPLFTTLKMEGVESRGGAVV